MSFSCDRVLPHLVHAWMKQANFEPYRRRVTGEALGRVLEIGVGSGIALPLHARATHVVGLDPPAGPSPMARGGARWRPFD